MSSSNAKALNSMRQNLKKNNKNFESEIKTFRETPQDSDSEDESEEYSDSYESASEDELDEGGEFEQVKSKAEREKDKFMQKDPKDITYGMVMKRSQELIMQRGKKGTDRKDMVLQMKFLTNCISVNPDNGKPADSAVFETISMINHSCIPNVAWFTESEDWTRKEVRACKRIEEGEEIVASYIDLSQLPLRQQRREMLRPTWNFVCRLRHYSLNFTQRLTMV